MIKVILQGKKVKEELKQMGVKINKIIIDYVNCDFAIVDIATLKKLSNFTLQTQTIFPIADAELFITNEYGQIEF